MRLILLLAVVSLSACGPAECVEGDVSTNTDQCDAFRDTVRKSLPLVKLPRPVTVTHSATLRDRVASSYSCATGDLLVANADWSDPPVKTALCQGLLRAEITCETGERPSRALMNECIIRMEQPWRRE